MRTGVFALSDVAVGPNHKRIYKIKISRPIVKRMHDDKIRAATRDKTNPPRKPEAEPRERISCARTHRNWNDVSVHSQIAESFLSLPHNLGSMNLPFFLTIFLFFYFLFFYLITFPSTIFLIYLFDHYDIRVIL